MTALPHHEIREHIVRIVLASGEGDLTEPELRDAAWSLTGMGYSSLSYIRMIDAVENELGVQLDPEIDTRRFETVDGIVELVHQSLADG